MRFINTDTREELDESGLRLAYPFTSFPDPFEAPEGWARIEEVESPTFDPLTHRIERVPAELMDGQWRGAWRVIELTADERRALKQALVPVSVSRRQAQQALLYAGLYDDVEPAIALIPDELQRRLALIEWNTAATFERNSALVLQIGVALGRDADDLDDLFIHADTL